jgi:hypothetical protein
VLANVLPAEADRKGADGEPMLTPSVGVKQVEGPLLNSYIVLPTECLEDNGLPHTLEHLCFLGSEDFP